MQRQAQSNWCWAATAVSVDQHYPPSGGWTQCSLANSQLTRNDCCPPGSSGACNKASRLEDALGNVGHFSRPVHGIVSADDLRQQLGADHPVGVRIGWRGGNNGHFVVVSACLADDTVRIEDPHHGTRHMPYSKLETAYPGNGAWTNTYYTHR